MPAPIPVFTDPADHPPEDRTRAVAAVLAAGLLRLSRHIIPCPPSRKSVR
ncbi:MAG TPA: hypothetical protein VKE74_18395 [Gemmataceae bacterium]|nr:hypothetical protein [Gemmataceae bacterium]